MIERTKTVLAVGTLALALTGAGAGIAAAQTTTPDAPATTSAHPGEHHRGLRAVEQGEFTVHTKNGDKVVDFQHGTVTAVDASSVTVQSVDGFSATYTLDATTKVHKDRSAAAIGDIAVNDRIRLRAVKTGTMDTAKHIADVGPGK
ncbi:hypothetical protein ACNHUS_32200 [Actinomycetes bacterium M1A6_2h]